MIEKIVPFNRDVDIVKMGTTYITKRGTRITAKTVGSKAATFVYAKTGGVVPHAYSLTGLDEWYRDTPGYSGHVTSRVITDVEVLPFKAGVDTLVDGETYVYMVDRVGIAAVDVRATPGGTYKYCVGEYFFSTKGRYDVWHADSKYDVTGHVVEKKTASTPGVSKTPVEVTVPLSDGEELVLGITYKTRGGNAVTLVRSGYKTCPFKGSNGNLYYPSGKSTLKGKTKYDIVSKVVPMAPKKVPMEVTVPLSNGESLVPGGTYKDRTGETIKLRTETYEGNAYPFMGTKNRLYTRNGLYCIGEKSTFDLVSKVVSVTPQSDTASVAPTPPEKPLVSMQKQYAHYMWGKVRIVAIDSESILNPVIFRLPDSDNVYSCDKHGYVGTSQVIIEHDPRSDLKLDDNLWVRQSNSTSWQRACYREKSTTSEGVVVYSHGKNSHTGTLTETFMQFTTTNPEEQK